MKVFCVRCMRWILDTSDKFVCGGPYNGSMFQKSDDGLDNFAHYFLFHSTTTEGNLFCPFCDQKFMHENDILLTEHGLIMPGQGSVDTSISCIYPDNTLKSDSMPSREKDRRGSVGKRNPFLQGSVESAPDTAEEAIKPISEALEAILGKHNTGIVAEKKKQLTCKKCGKPIPYAAAHRNGCD